MLQDGKVDFEIRSVFDDVADIFDKNRKVTVGKWIQTTGKGAAEAADLSTKTLY